MTLLIPFLCRLFDTLFQLFFAISLNYLQIYPKKAWQIIFGKILIPFSPPPLALIWLYFPFLSLMLKMKWIKDLLELDALSIQLCVLVIDQLKLKRHFEP